MMHVWVMLSAQMSYFVSFADSCMYVIFVVCGSH